jgi:hypothetical protein
MPTASLPTKTLLITSQRKRGLATIRTNSRCTWMARDTWAVIHPHHLSTSQHSQTTRRKGKHQMRVQIPAYTDRWMMGDRYGEVVKVTKARKGFPTSALVSADTRGTYIEVAHVKLDKSGKTARFVLNDCTPV